MIKIFLICFLFSSFLFTEELANKKEFMKMCNNPTPAQKITLESIATSNLIKINEKMCKNIIRKFIAIEIDYLKIHDSDTQDLSPLLYFPHLTSLSLTRSKVKDISILKHLTKLKELDLSNNPLNDLSPLKDLKYLEDLDLSSTKVTDLIPLKNLKHLEDLNLYNTKITDLSPINNVKTLKSLSYSNHNSTEFDITQIKDLINLEYLSVLHVKIKNFFNINNLLNLKRFIPPTTVTVQDMSSLKNLKKLESLDLSNNKSITNIDFVVNFPELSSLDINNTNVENIDILKNVQSLKYLDIRNTKVTDASAITGRQNFVLSSYSAIFIDLPFTRFDTAPLKWCSPKNTQDVKNGKSCYEKDGTLKPFWKRWLGL
jgi:Leucine-rich repeat (LRR) protein